jgi:hypothetical protein
VLLKQVDFNPATAGFRRPGLGVELHDAHHLPTHPSFPPSGFEHTTQCSFLHYHFTTISPFPLFEGFRSLHPTLLRRDLDSLSLASSVYLLHRLIRPSGVPSAASVLRPLFSAVCVCGACSSSFQRSHLHFGFYVPPPRISSSLSPVPPQLPDSVCPAGSVGAFWTHSLNTVPFLALTEYTPNPPPLLTSLPLRTLPFSSSFSVLVGGVGVRLGYHGWPPLVGPR